MAQIEYPNRRALMPARFSWDSRSNVLPSTSPLNGSVQTIELPGDRWRVGMGFAAIHAPGQAEREAFWALVRGRVNRIALWHLVRPVPRGTLRGSPTLSASISSGAALLPIQATAGATLAAGDLVGLLDQVHMVVQPAVADGAGAMQVSISPPRRSAAPVGAAVVWDRPKAVFMVEADAGVSLGTAYRTGQPFSVDLIEDLAR